MGLGRRLLHSQTRCVPSLTWLSTFPLSAAHYAKLHDVLRRLGGADMTSYLLEQPAPAEQRDAGPLPARTCPRPRGLLLQDISSNNLLLKPAGQGCEVLFSDPSRAEPIDGLERAAECAVASLSWPGGASCMPTCINVRGWGRL